jgi:biopolymer transport protein ExbD
VAAADSDGDDDMITGINVTPLVDVTLVLLIIFMVTAKLVVNRALPHDLPKAASAVETEVVFAVTVDGREHVTVGGTAVAGDGVLRDRAVAALRKTPDARAVIQASGDVRHATIVRVMDTLRQGGFAKIGFAVERSAPLPPSEQPVR